MTTTTTATATLPTCFLPAERAEEAELRRHVELFGRVPLAGQMLEAAMGFAMVLNRHRQIVFLNQAFKDHLAASGAEFALGMRPGEALDCGHAGDEVGGCGTSEACRYCGAAQAIAAGLVGRQRVRECRILSEDSGDELDLLVKATPLELEGEKFVVFTAVDISHEKRRRALERVFFHDIANTAGGLNGLAELIQIEPSEAAAREYAPLMVAASGTLLDEIASQRDLAAAESCELVARPTGFYLAPLLRELAQVCGAHIVGLGRSVVVEAVDENLLLHTDRGLVQRVLANLVKNALEAEPRGSTVTVRAWGEGERAVCEVHNPTVMPRETQLQVFQRSFSTKGDGRGLGTYSVRLLTERYLRGEVTFSSRADKGTVFRVELPKELASAEVS